ncbi:hypothetical protein POSPLADRAFT_1060554 [Postia placenta MAD-698-R-SB12]|uniref:Uncharacterized protein n=1 Tax=Postia placenta MAD-698-R-SB12 TaxID=670580 RepID=A0A1X6MQJ3_9APHY|nr:hypothetical protein POSPLADRAFT_1060554 [Postia placenta MAD-698-R-SB12]OSX58661.1 hypothetical protein POSPLADRAFT_1060554 [Postia placenta MAD-698-R-SB12]
MRTRVLTRQLADCLWFPRSIILWNVVAGEKTVALNNHDGFIDTLAFSPGGKKLASGSVDFTVRGWDVESGRQQFLLTALVMVVTFSPDGTQLASGSADCDTRVWDAETGMVISVLKGRQGVVYSVRFRCQSLVSIAIQINR